MLKGEKIFLASLFFSLSFYFSMTHCSSNNSSSNGNSGNLEIVCSEDNPQIFKVVEIQPDKLWTDTGIILKKGYDVLIEIDDERTFGKDEVNFSNPVIFAGQDAVIFKIGESGVPQPVGEVARFTAASEHENQKIFLGWNSIEPLVRKKQNESGEEIIEKPSPITAVIKVFIPETSKTIRRTALLAPVNNFWTDETNPRFYWDAVDNAIRYIFQISDYPDFRRIIETVEISASGGQANPVSVVGGGTQQNVQFNLREGIYWWRVRTQVNLGRSLNPVPVWSCWSEPFRLGVELGTPPQPPTFLSPTTLDVFKPGDTINFEFTTQDDPSFVFWRMRHVVSECDQQPSINPNDPNSGNPTPWHIFRVKLGEGNIKEIPNLIGYYKYENLERGNHLFRVEVKDANDQTGVGIRSSDFRVSVGCEEESQGSATQPSQGGQSGGGQNQPGGGGQAQPGG
jgi:hypothetical protein